MELAIIARFHAQEGKEAAVEAAIREVIPQSRAEPACLYINGHRSIRDPRLFHIYSRWTDETTFERHATLAHTVKFIATVERLIDHPLDIVRAEVIA
jgi:quinol monooxygenase YgiN